MGRWAQLAEHLVNGGDRVRLTWNELEGLVGTLPASALGHRAWWSGDRPHVRAWREAGFALETLVPGDLVEFRRSASASVTRRPTSAAGAGEVPVPAAKVLLIACVKTKLDVAAEARNLYVSSLFVKGRRYAESRSIPWFILSAKYGLVAPDEWLEPYEMYLPEMSSSERTSWGAGVVERLEAAVGLLEGSAVEIHAGRAYVDALRAPLSSAGAQIVDPLSGLRQGERLRWYNTRSFPFVPAAAVGVAQTTTNRKAEVIAKAAVAHLLDRRAAVSPDDFVARGRSGLVRPGLYSWWVDDDGADDLSAGLGEPLEQGLIYAGAAGATRWPSGQRSTNTLWGRIAGMHLGRSQELSTFRKTLAAVLGAAWSTPGVDEDLLTAWMRRHLFVISLVSPDADQLGQVEETVLERIDPPFNLQGMERTATRRRVSELRRALPSTRPRTRDRRS